MISAESTLARLLCQRVIPVLGCTTAEDAIERGLTVVELTLTTPEVHSAVRELRDRGLGTTGGASSGGATGGGACRRDFRPSRYANTEERPT